MLKRIAGAQVGREVGPWLDSALWLKVGKRKLCRVEQAYKIGPAEPVCVGSESGRTYWLFRKDYYETTENLSPEDVRALALEGENRKRLKLEKAHALMAMREQLDSTAKRQPIPQEVKVAVWQRDGGRCVECGSQRELEYDHIIPLAMGGANTERNLQLLCAPCNRRKGATLG